METAYLPTYLYMVVKQYGHLMQKAQKESQKSPQNVKNASNSREWKKAY